MKPLLSKPLLLLAALVIAGVALYLVVGKLRDVPRSLPPAPPPPATTVTVTLFFHSPDARGLVREPRTMEKCSGDTPACIHAILKELAAGPAGDGAPVIPATSTFNGIHLEGTTAVIDLGKNFAAGVPEGSAAEMAAVYGIVNTVVANFPTITSVRLLQDGRTRDTLKGHLDLSGPLEADFSLEKTAH